jgi:hypothetical protein
MKLTKLVIALTLILATLIPANSVNSSPLKPKIQIAILLDSSNSMDGLIDQTRSQIWKIVNYLTKVTKNGKTPELEVGLYEYGNDGLASEKGYLRKLNSFTTDLDSVSEKLFGIKTLGGQEYAGWAINSAMKELEWTGDPEDFQTIFIAGNEEFDQGPISFKESIKMALSKGTSINTIYCGETENAERKLWAEGARLAKGNHFNINQNRQKVYIESPYDAEISQWNEKLNKTYIPYGQYGTRGQERQVAQDANSNEEISSRGFSKASQYYKNASWDLVDAIEDKIVKLEDLKNEDLPKEMQGMSIEQKYQYIANKKVERQKIQAKIRELYELRTKYVEKKSKEINADTKDTLDYVMIQALKEQLAAKGFVINN